MLRVQVLVLDLLKQLRPVLTAIGRKDASLENQLRRAATSVALNLAEGVASSGGTKRLRYQTALGSLSEVAMALGYLTSLDATLSMTVADAGRMIAGLARR
jgi:four helix bundle protein